MSTLFIADLHLCPKKPEVTSGFLRFLQSDAVHADALYILGDLFESWIGDDETHPLQRLIAVVLRQLKYSGVPCYFIHGNRDFLLSKKFARASGMQLLPDEIVLELYTHHILILHGDTLCTADKTYQYFRRIVRNPLIQKLFLDLPLRLRLCIAAKIRTRSQQSNQCKTESIMDVSQQAVKQIMLEYEVRCMIHGHTHRPAVHQLNLNNTTAYRAVLGAWHIEGSMIKVSADAIELILSPFRTFHAANFAHLKVKQIVNNRFVKQFL